MAPRTLSCKNEPDQTGSSLLPAITLALALLPSSAPALDYGRDIQPLLADNCYACHGPDRNTRQAGLRFDQRQSATGPAKSGKRPIIPGDSAASEMIRRITSDDPDYMMPPPEAERRPSAAAKALLAQWIDEGAVYTVHWAFQPIVKSKVPQVHRADWPGNHIDHFILAKLEAQGMKPSPEADKMTLARRLSLDFRGLPPEIDELEVWENLSHESMVEIMLASPHYGERMAQDWLDLARFGDTNGYHSDSNRAMWLYRDYVIEAFNANKPYDQFIIENMAGDLLTMASDETRIASGFNRCVTFNEEGGADPDEFYVTYAVDRANTTGLVFLGLTVGCAQCHDHKYDPISQKEYYQLYAFFNSVDGELGAGGQFGYHNKPLPPLLKVETPDVREKLAVLNAEMAKAEQALADAQGRAKYRDPEGELKQPLKRWIGSLATDQPRVLTVKDGLTLWLDAANVEVEAGSVIGWRDTSGLGNDAESTGSPRLGPRSFNGPPSIRLDGEQDFLRTKSGAEKLTGDFTIVMALSFHQMNGNQMALMWGDEAVGKRRAFWKTAKDHKLSFNGYGADVVGSGSFTKDFPAVVMISKTGSDHEIALTLNGAGGGSGKPGLNAFTNRAITIGANNAGGEKAAMDLAEVLLYDRALRPAERASVGAWLSAKYGIAGSFLPAPKPILEIAALPEADRSEEQRRRLFQHFVREVYPESRDLFNGLETSLAKLREQRKRVEAAAPTTMVMVERKERKPAYVLRRGDFQQPGERVLPDVPAIFPRLPPGKPRNRLGLAHWLTDANHPLVARVTVNRLWKHLFGTGLVKTLGDFGTQGDRPRHPELLDWLAADFIEHGWDVKRLQKMIATSSIYRQSSRHPARTSQRDPDNRLLSRASRFRLSAEEVRDAALQVSGLLHPRIGGPSVNPPQPQDYLQSIGKSWKDSTGEARFRRGLYTFWRRTMLYPSFQIFDAPSREFCSVNRPRTNTPLQALVTLNDPAFVEAARHFGKRVLRDGGESDAQRLTYAFRAATSRAPNADELALLHETLAEQRREFEKNESAAKDFAPGDDPELPAWAALGNILLNLDETITRE